MCRLHASVSGTHDAVLTYSLYDLWAGGAGGMSWVDWWLGGKLKRSVDKRCVFLCGYGQEAMATGTMNAVNCGRVGVQLCLYDEKFLACWSFTGLVKTRESGLW